VISQHRAPIRFLDDLDDRIEFRGMGQA
jgi:hypothetical protein